MDNDRNRTQPARRRRRKRRLNKKKVAIMAVCALVLVIGLFSGVRSIVRHFITKDAPGAGVKVPD